MPLLPSIARCAASLLLGVLVMAGPAPAATWHVAGDEVPRAGPALAGKRIAWVARREDGPGGDLYVARTGGDPRLVRSFPRDTVTHRSSLLYGFQLAGSSSRLLVGRHRSCVGFDPCGNRSDLFTGPLDGPLTRFERCKRDLLGIDLEGELAAFPRCDGRLVVRDLSGAHADLVLGTNVRSASLAGRYVAWADAGDAGTTPTPDIVVYDRVARVVAYTVKDTAVVGDLQLRRDGTVVFAFHPNATYRLRTLVGRASVAAPQRRRVLLPARSSYEVRLSGDRLAFLRTASGPDDADKPSEVGVSDMEGNATIITRNAPHVSDIDLRGRTLAYVVRRKHRVTVRTERLP